MLPLAFLERLDDALHQLISRFLRLNILSRSQQGFERPVQPGLLHRCIALSVLRKTSNDSLFLSGGLRAPVYR